MGETPSTRDPLLLFDELLLEGRAPAVDEFCARYPDPAPLAARARALVEMRRRLQRLARPTAGREPGRFGIPGYEILAPLGRGGMGAVYLARQHAPSRLCALKVLDREAPVSLSRFRREAELAASLQHPGKTGKLPDREDVLRPIAKDAGWDLQG